MTDTIAEIRARHEAEDATIEANFGVLAQGWATQAHADRAVLLEDRAVLLARVAEMEAALSKIAHPQAAFAGPECCKHTFSDACELFADIAAAALRKTP